MAASRDRPVSQHLQIQGQARRRQFFLGMFRNSENPRRHEEIDEAETVPILWHAANTFSLARKLSMEVSGETTDYRPLWVDNSHCVHNHYDGRIADTGRQFTSTAHEGTVHD